MSIKWFCISELNRKYFGPIFTYRFYYRFNYFKCVVKLEMWEYNKFQQIRQQGLGISFWFRCT